MPFSIVIILEKIAVFLVLIVGPLIARILAALGMGVTVYKGIDIALDQIKEYISSSWSAMPADIAGVLSLAGFDSAMTIIISVCASALAVKFVNGSIKKIGFTKKGAA